MSRTIVKLRVVKTVTRALGSGIRESFWEVQQRHAFRWRTRGVHSTASEAYEQAKKIASDE